MSWYNVEYRDLPGPNIRTEDHAGKPQITGINYYTGIPSKTGNKFWNGNHAGKP